jgi:hypothetical protein
MTAARRVPHQPAVEGYDDWQDEGEHDEIQDEEMIGKRRRRRGERGGEEQVPSWVGKAWDTHLTELSGAFTEARAVKLLKKVYRSTTYSPDMFAPYALFLNTDTAASVSAA